MQRGSYKGRHYPLRNNYSVPYEPHSRGSEANKHERGYRDNFFFFLHTHYSCSHNARAMGPTGHPDSTHLCTASSGQVNPAARGKYDIEKEKIDVRRREKKGRL